MAFVNTAPKGTQASPAPGTAPSPKASPTAQAAVAKKKPRRGNIGRMLREKMG